MASDISFVEYAAEQMEDAGRITYRKMFGEFAVYCNAKVVALICDNQLFVKPTQKGREYIGSVNEAAPYPGAKMYFLVDDKLEDKEWTSNLIRITAKELPLPKKKVKKTNKTQKRFVKVLHN